MSAIQPAASFRSDVQGMRAVAVLAVLAYHVWPTALTGGFVGVDVFFVISGYLITGLLVRELERSGTLGLRTFYARRIRRLLPAASATLLAAAMAIVAWVPPSQWQDLARELFASAFYFENLLLVDKAVDYLALDAAPSPVQHFWSLSVEEQFYIGWPLLMIMTAGVASRRGLRTRNALSVVLAAVTFASLGWGIHLTRADPASAYFVTTTRVWELGLGGLLATATSSGPARPALQRFAGWAGLAAIIASAAWYTSRTPFPGVAALLPTVGAAAMLYAKAPADSVLGRLLGARPMQYVGDVSYSLYLWHWLVVVFYESAFGRALSSVEDGVTAIVVSLVLAHASKFLIEERFRHPVPGERVRPWALGGALSACVLLAGGAASWHADRVISAALSPKIERPGYPGAAALLPGAPAPQSLPFIPAAGVARMDRGPAYGVDGGRNCIADALRNQFLLCEYGDPASRVHVVVVGDSHAVHWLPAFERIANERGWRVTGITKSSCPMADVMVRFIPRGRSEDEQEDAVSCRDWGRRTMAWLLEHRPSLVVLSQSPLHALTGRSPEDSRQDIAAGIGRFASQLAAAGITVAALNHTPLQQADGANCLSVAGNTVESCSTRRADALGLGAMPMAAAQVEAIHLIDMEPFFCVGDRCPVVIGNILVYRDRNHLSATYARSLAPMLAARLDPLVLR